jgi:CopG family nickel-responsive transcriptional regulator
MEILMQRITVTIDDELISEVDRFGEARGYQTRSEAIRDLARAGLQTFGDESDKPGDCVATLIYVFDHNVRELSKRLAEIQHNHHDLSIATVHVHLDHASCLAISVLRGRSADVDHLAKHVIAQRGVRHGKLVMIPVDLREEKHSHTGEKAHTHTHMRVRHAG